VALNKIPKEKIISQIESSIYSFLSESNQITSVHK